MLVKTDAPLFYRYLTEREIEWRQRQHPLILSDVTALGSHYGSFSIDETELNTLVLSTPLKPDVRGAHHRVWIGRWELGMSWDRHLVSRKETEERFGPLDPLRRDLNRIGRALGIPKRNS